MGRDEVRLRGGKGGILEGSKNAGGGIFEGSKTDGGGGSGVPE